MALIVDPPSETEWRAGFDQIKALMDSMPAEARLTPLLPIGPNPKMARLGESAASISFVMERSMGELCYFQTFFARLLREGAGILEPADSTRIRALCYCHFLEGDLPQLNINNCLRVALRRDVEPYFRRNRESAASLVVADLPGDRIDIIFRHAARLKIAIGILLKRLWKSDLRNAFSHAQYCVHASGEFELTGWISPAARDDPRESRKAYRADEVAQLYESASQYLRAFIAFYEASIAPFKVGGPHPTFFGKVSFDRKSGWHFGEPRS